MRRKRKHSRNTPHSSATLSFQKEMLPLRRIVGMISVKTIRSPDGTIIIKQGEKIREEVFRRYEEEVISEIIANAMPVGK